MSTYGPYRARFVSLHDGDTLSFDIDLGWGLVLRSTDFDGHPRLSCRVYGINAPELGTPEGKAAEEFLASLLPVGTVVSLLSYGWDMYGGRYDAKITLPDGRDLGEVMVESGHAVTKNYGGTAS